MGKNDRNLGEARQRLRGWSVLRFYAWARHILKPLSHKGDGTLKARYRRVRVEGERLAFYGKSSDVAFWDQRWKNKVCLAAYTEALKGKLPAHEKLFNDYLPRNGRILDAGCGLGKGVVALWARGYNCEGVDWADQTIKAVKGLFPALPVRVGDLRHLDVPDGYYAAYISLGVVEHTIDGPEPFLQEAQRILAPGGVAFFSVPHFHALRRLKANLGLYNSPRVADAFHQYAFTPREFSTIVTRHGFKILRTFQSNVGLGLAMELPLIKRLLGLRFIGGILWRGFELLPLADRYFGHMFLVVARRT